MLVVLFSDKRRNRIKTLDEYYHIRANITSESIAQEILELSKPRDAEEDSSRTQINVLVLLLGLSWIILLLSVFTDTFERHPLTVETVLSPFAWGAYGVWHTLHLPVTLPMALYGALTSRAQQAIHSFLPHAPNAAKRTAFVGRRANIERNSVFHELALGRANHIVATQRKAAFVLAQDSRANAEVGTKLNVFDNTAKGLFNLAALIDGGLNSQLTIAAPNDNTQESEHVNAEWKSEENDANEVEAMAAELKAAESKLKPLQDYATGITFEPKLDAGLYLVGVGVRKKSIVKLYAVAMYSSAAVLSASSPSSLNAVARAFGPSTPMTTFVLEMVYSVGAEKIAGAIAESVKPRYSGSAADVSELEAMIVDGVNSIGGQASKGTVFRFDCSQEGVGVSVNGRLQGVANFDGLGSAFVDVFMDTNAVSPTLVDNCIDSWSSSESKALASSLVELTNLLSSDSPKRCEEGDDGSADESNEGADAVTKRAVEARMKPLQDYATSVSFDAKLDEGLYLVGVGVRKKSIISVYAVSMYSSAAVIEVLSRFPGGKQQRKDASAALHSAARTFSPSTPTTTFVLETVYSVSAEKIAGAIAESIKPRYGGNPSDISALESLIVEGVNRKGGQASKGTIFRFDCSEDGVRVSVDGSSQGIASFAGLGSALVDVFMDANAVSPTLVDSCLDTWTGVSLE